MPSSPWVVLKFGGTSVSSLARWLLIRGIARQRLEAGERVLLVCSALAGVSNLLVEAAARAPRGEHEPVLAQILARHRAFAEELGVDPAEADPALDELKRTLLGASLLGELSPTQEARILATGELALSRLAAAWMRAQGEALSWLDARELLRSEPQAARPERSLLLQAHVGDELDPELIVRLNSAGNLALTQGFIARDHRGRTVLLGRGGSDTSASLFAARLGAARCEIWTDVPGMFTANPAAIPSARLLLHLGYDEAQEIASTGAKVLHPRCLPPLRRHGIPLEIRCTQRPELAGTRVSGEGAGGGSRVFAISARRGVTLVSMDTVGMWHQAGFLADAFACFKARGLSIDLVSTSESNVTVTLDPSDTALAPGVLAELLADLAPLCRASAIEGCAAVSLVGRRIRGLLHKLGPALQAFEEKRIHMLTQAASDLNLTFVVDEGEADRLVKELHALLFDGSDPALGPTWSELEQQSAAVRRASPWWEAQAGRLCAMELPRYVLHGPTIDRAAKGLLALKNVGRVLYAMKANPHPEVLRRLVALGVGLECVSPGELARAFEACPDLEPERVLFTPNFAPREEYVAAFELGVRVTLDNLEPLRLWPEVFAGRELHLRIDPGSGRGHHDHVRTGGSRSKFGIAREELAEVIERCGALRVVVRGLHAHAGSGIRSPEHWAEVGAFLAELARELPAVEVLDLGGGLGVPTRPGEAPLDLAELDRRLGAIRQAHPQYALWLEPGRFLVAEAGVLVARVTQTKQKGMHRYVGIGTGMNSLIRPALYGAWHEVVNLSRLGEPATERLSVVGPICESGDTLARDRLLPETQAGDVLLIGLTGAYGSSMSSRYNLREPAEEVLIEDHDRGEG